MSSHLRVLNASVPGGMAWAAQLQAVMEQYAWAAAVQTPGGAAGQFAAHQALLVALRAQQAGAAGGGAAAAATPGAGSSANETSSFGPAVDQGHKSLTEMREERQVHPNSCISALFFSLYMYTYTYTYRCNNCILYFLVLTKPVPA